MADLTRRLQVLLTGEQFDFLKETSRSKKKPVGDLVRQAIERAYRPSSSTALIPVLEELKDIKFIKETSVDEIRARLSEIRSF